MERLRLSLQGLLASLRSIHLLLLPRCTLRVLQPSCRVLKLFRLASKLGRTVLDMKLNNTKVRYILRQNRTGIATEEIAWDVNVSQRRVQQIIKEYKETGQEPVLDEKVGRPRKPFIEKEAEVVRASSDTLSPCLLYTSPSPRD